jgi:small subunit ribosomal protein S6
VLINRGEIHNTMKKYELMTITKASLSEDDARNISNSIKDSISSNRGKIMNSDFWGKRKFAYEISKQTEGYYDVVVFDMDAKNLENLKTKLNKEELLLRYLITSSK